MRSRGDGRSYVKYTVDERVRCTKNGEHDERTFVKGVEKDARETDGKQRTQQNDGME